MFDSVQNSIWHAFDFLAVETNRVSAKKSKLKVLTANLGHILAVPSAEAGLEHFRSTPTLTFSEFRLYLQSEVFSSLPDRLSREEQQDYEARIDEVCWLICNPPYLERGDPVLMAPCVQQLWRVFCMLGEVVEEEEGVLEVVMAAAEVEAVVHKLVAGIGREEEWDPEQFDSVVSVIPAFKFSIFLAVVESKYARDVDKETLEEAVKEVADMFLEDVIRKGKLRKHMGLLPTFREHWAVLQPTLITLYSSSREKEVRGVIPLSPGCRVEAAPAQTTTSTLSPVKQKPHRFFLHANQKVYQFQTHSHKSRLQWISSLKKAIDNSGEEECERYQQRQALQRRGLREAELARRLSHTDMVQQTRAELELEKEAREEAEAHAALLTEQRELEGKRLKELELIKQELEQLLEEEKQAKRDEELVRTIQARMLTEEWERREVLERLQAEQAEMLDHERTKREEFESVQDEREAKVKEAEKRVRDLEDERQRLDDELKKHVERTRRVNIGQEVLEAKMKVKEQECEISREAASRVTSLNPAASFYIKRNRGPPTAPGQEEPHNGYRPMRSASMRETSYSRSIRRRNRAADSISIRSNCNLEEVNNNKGE